MLTNILVCVGAGLTLVKVFPVILVGRFIYGVAAGSFSVFVPKFSMIYKLVNNSIVNETAPTELKGPLGTMTQLFITVGIMVSFFFGLAIPDAPTNPQEYADYTNSWKVQQYWRFMFGFPIIMAAIQVLLLLTVFRYDTPKMLK